MEVALILVPLLVLVVGALAWALSTNGKIQRMGEIAFCVGLFWLVGAFATHTIQVRW